MRNKETEKNETQWASDYAFHKIIVGSIKSLVTQENMQKERGLMMEEFR